MENSSDGPLNGLEGEAVGGSGILGIVCTRFVRKPGTHGNLRLSGIPGMSKLRVFNAQDECDSRRLHQQHVYFQYFTGEKHKKSEEHCQV
jgi:hypothetical protein